MKRCSQCLVATLALVVTSSISACGSKSAPAASIESSAVDACGPTPDEPCELCVDGTLACPHWVLRGGECAVEVCPEARDGGGRGCGFDVPDRNSDCPLVDAGRPDGG